MPSMDEETVWYLETFFLLNSSRQSGMGIGSIPLSEITNYGSIFEIIPELHTFCLIITSMDGAYMKYANEQTKNKKKG